MSWAREKARAASPDARPVGLTPKQHEALRFVPAYVERHGSSPSFEEISAGIRTVKSSVHRLVAALVERGHLAHKPNRARLLVLASPGELTIRLPAAAAQLVCRRAAIAGASPEQIAADAVRTYLTRDPGA